MPSIPFTMTCGLLLLLFPSPGRGAGPPLDLEGTFQQGGMVVGYTAPGTEVLFQGRPLRVSDSGAFLFGFGRDAPSSAVLTLIGPFGERISRRLEVRARRYRVQRINGLPGRLVTPRPGDLARILLERTMLRRARNHDSPLTGFLGPFRWPVKGRITSAYGSRRILNGQPRRPHLGVDIAAPPGTPVRAPAPGRVRLAAEGLYFSGETLVIDHGHGLASSYMHLERILVREGEYVRRGQIIARVGATGRVTGPHLDWRVTLFGCHLDPELVAGPPPPADPEGSPGSEAAPRTP
ncbi:MAG TPA: M23 family metallopeptidase [Gammaproteobacteria bacterium]|nr:M23 family metallopeptidase [Gammaproteobacteria bacterium]